MKKIGVLFDENGLFAGDCLEDMETPEGYTLFQGDIPEGLGMPKLVDGIVVEGAVFDLEAYKDNKIESLYTLCNEAVLGIFTSSALGVPHEYIFDYEAQMNLAGTKQAFDSALVTSVEWNTRDAGVLVHDATQFNQLWLDGFTHKISTINKYRTSKDQIMVAMDKPEVDFIFDSIVW